MARVLSTTWSILITSALFAQEQIGIVHSNYAGTDAVGLNPARLSGQWAWTDIRIVGADIFAWNDHVYVRGRDRSVLGEVRESVRTADGDRFSFNESLASGDRAAFVMASVKGPAVAMSRGLNGFGAHIATRFGLSVSGVGNGFARFAYNGLTYTPQHGIRYEERNMRVLAAAWTEFGASYARQLVSRDFTRLSIGATAKYLVGHGGAALGFGALDYTVLDTVAAVIHQASGEYGLAMPAMNAGKGFAFDAGVTYERTLEEADGYIPHTACDPLGYKYRIGFSLIDIGGLRFADAYAGSFDASVADFSDYPAVEANDADAVDSLISASLSAFQRRDQLRIGLPTAASLQYDQRVMDHVYVAGALVQNLSFGDALRIRRPNTVSIAPRFETRRFELAVPVTMYEYDPRRSGVGVMLRLNNLVIGSDNMLPLLTRGNLYGLDAYVRLKWTIFRSPVCRGKKKAAHRPGDGNALPCVLPE